MIPKFESYTRKDGAQCQAYQLDTQLILIYPEADKEEGEILAQSGESGDYITVLTGEDAIVYGAGLGICPQDQFEAIWHRDADTDRESAMAWRAAHNRVLSELTKRPTD